MADHTINALSAAARALDEVIFDAVDAGHPLAREQTRLVSKYLNCCRVALSTPTTATGSSSATTPTSLPTC